MKLLSFFRQYVSRYELAVVAISVIFGVMFYLQPYINDDLWYMAGLGEYLRNPSVKTLWNSVTSCLSEHFNYDNARLANVFGSVLLLLPKCLSSCILGASVGCGLYMMGKLAGVWHNDFVLFSIISFFFIFAFPWNDNMFLVIYASNYVVSTSVALFALMSFLGIYRMGWLAACLTGFIAGAWHEGFSGPLLCGMLSMALLFRDCRRAKCWAVIVCVGLGILYLSLAPGTACRIQRMGHGEGFFNLLNGAFYGFMGYAAFFLTILLLLFKKSRSKLLGSPIIVGLFVMVLVSWGIWRYFMGGSRSAWFMNVSAVVLLGYVFANVIRCPWPLLKSRVMMGVLPVLIWGFTAAHLFVSVQWFYRMNEETEFALKQYKDNPSETIYMPMTRPWDPPLLAWNKPNFGLFATKFTYIFWSILCNDGDDDDFPLLNAVPESLKYFAARNASRIDEGYLFDGNIVVPGELAEPFTVQYMTIRFGDGVVETFGWVTPFEGADGKPYLYVIPVNCFKEAKMSSSIDGIRIHGEATDI